MKKKAPDGAFLVCFIRHCRYVGSGIFPWHGKIQSGFLHFWNHALRYLSPGTQPQHLFPSNAIIVDGHGALLKRLPIVNHENYKKNYAIWRGSPPKIVDTHPNERAHQIIAEEIVSKIQSSEEKNWDDGIAE